MVCLRRGRSVRPLELRERAQYYNPAGRKETVPELSLTQHPPSSCPPPVSIPTVSIDPSRATDVPLLPAPYHPGVLRSSHPGYSPPPPWTSSPPFPLLPSTPSTGTYVPKFSPISPIFAPI
ncbi:hypothetical protein AHF37_09432 [Paragonimus kellicotti]|nr:hypothetical protein AHF37_09432 [Paragonimus kellicotti]